MYRQYETCHHIGWRAAQGNGEHAVALAISDVRGTVQQACARQDVLDACARRDLGTVITLLRAHGVTQGQISALTGISQGRLSEWVTRKRRPQASSTFESFADGVGLPPAAREALGLAAEPPGGTAAVLPASLGRGVKQEQAGFELKRAPVAGDAVADGARYPDGAAAAVSLLDTLAGADMGDSPEVMRSGWVPDTAPGVITGYLFSSPVWRDGSLSADSVGSSIADRIREFTRHLADLDFQYGGGHVRRMLLFYFRNEIVPLLRNSHTGPARREILSAAAGVAQLLGWSAYDAGRHGLSQRYYMQGLRLAQEAEDPVFGAYLLSDLSHQANYLGRYNEALQFARAAQTSAAGKAGRTVTAMTLAMEARALASSGDSRSCAQVLHRAEQAFARRDPDSDPPWISYFDELELAGEAAHCFRDLRQPRETQLFAAQAMDPIATPPRTQGFISMVTAAGAFEAGNLDEALSFATAAVGLTGSLESSRYVRYLTDFHQSVTQRHANHPAVREFSGLLASKYPHLDLRAG
jgi:transcriptional regulator with XRE-family HTH domain